MNPRHQSAGSGFSLVELLIAAAIGAAVIGAAVMGFGLVTGLQLGQSTVNVELPSGVVANLYGTNASYVTMGNNPNYFQAAQARRMKDRLMSDVSAASAVFCLGRNSSTTPSLRTFELTVPAGADFRQYATPSTFRNFLAGAEGGLAGIFSSSQDNALHGRTNASIYLVGTLATILQNTNKLTILAIYELDFIPTVNPPGGTVASVRRYSGTNSSVPTDYYHIYYPDENNVSGGFRPPAAFFGRKAADESGSNPFAVAVNQPFTFVWWPDPLVSKLSAGPVPAASTDSARANFGNMAGRTSLFFVLPAFPSL